MAMTLRLSPGDDELLEELAKASGVSKHEAAVRAIREHAAQTVHAARVRELSQSARERYADLLDRLGS